jgi:hypothetical protein
MTDLDELLRLHGEATGGEWVIHAITIDDECQVYATNRGPCQACTVIVTARTHNARFIAAAHNALSGLVERVRKAEAERDALREVAEAAQARCDDADPRWAPELRAALAKVPR